MKSNGVEPRRIGLTVKSAASVITLLLVLNIALGYALVSQSTSAMKTLIQQRMLDISNPAAAMLDGDALERLAPDDVNTEAYRNAFETLDSFRRTIDLEYIYAIRQLEDGSFVFSVDPTPDDPGVFGEPVVSTPALEKAASGTSAADDTPYEDAWGRFYSAYSPVFNSQGEVAGIIAVDFNAEWFDEQVAAQARIAVIVGIVSLVVGAIVVLVIMSRFRNRFRVLHDELETLAGDMENFSNEVLEHSAARGQTAAQSAVGHEDTDAKNRGDIDAIGRKVSSMQDMLRAHIAIVQAQAYSDALTGVGSAAAYMEKVDELSQAIPKGDISFAVGVFDINGLKQANDTYGHEQGDRVIVDAASAIVEAFGSERVFRAGGDEFVVIMEQMDSAEIAARFAAFDEALSAINKHSSHDLPETSVSKGWSEYRPGEDNDYRPVFRRADEAMYSDKAEYYRTHPDRRRR